MSFYTLRLCPSDRRALEQKDGNISEVHIDVDIGSFQRVQPDHFQVGLLLVRSPSFLYEKHRNSSFSHVILEGNFSSSL
jgi:hypothetical protein